MTALSPIAHRVLVCGFPVLLLLSACSLEPPNATFERYMVACQEGEWTTVYDLLDAESRTRIDSTVQLLRRQMDVPLDTAASSLDLFVAMADESPMLYRQFDVSGYELVDVETTGGRAVITVRINRGPQQPVRLMRMRQEDGRWRMSL